MATKLTAQQLDAKYLTATYFSIFLGVLGVDRFYLGHVGRGVGKLLTFGGFGIWWLIDVILISLAGTTTASGIKLERSDKTNKPLFVGVMIFLVLEVFGAVAATFMYTAAFNSITATANSVSQISKNGGQIELTPTDSQNTGVQTIKVTFPNNK